MKKFIVSDLHIGHANICLYCHRQYKTELPNKNPVNFKPVSEMNEDIMSMFDELPDECEIWNLGDIFFHWFFGNRGDEEQIESKLIEFVNRMKGPNKSRKLYVVLGNHDNYSLNYQSIVELFYKIGFDEVYNKPIVVDGRYVLSHEPVYLAKGSNFINVHGHTHDIDIDDTYFMYDYVNYVQEKGKLPMTHPERAINLGNYKNVCLDRNGGILEWKDDCFELAVKFQKRNP